MSNAPLFALIVSGGALAATVRVPGDQPTIQAGIFAASEHDTVLVAPGTYTGDGNKNLYLNGVDRVLLSEGGAEVTMIDCQFNGRGFSFHGGETSATVLAGFTIAGAYVDGEGGAIRCISASSPTVVKCRLFDNEAEDGGAAIFCASQSAPTLRECEIDYNWVANGAVVDCENSSPTLQSCTITHNWGSIRCYGSSPTLRDCVITDNSAAGWHGGGGGIRCWNDSRPTLLRCVIRGNSGQSGGGVACVNDSPARILFCTIADNTAEAFGGGVYCSGSSPTLLNCIISGNSAVEEGGALQTSQSCSPQLINCTITGNVAGIQGGGLSFLHYYGSLSEPFLRNTILWGNEPDEIYNNPDYLADPTLRHCDVQGGWPGEGNIDADPRFGSYLDYDYVLWPGSPCIDAGTGEADGVDWDSIDPRYGDHNDPLPDMGAYGGPGAAGWLP